MTFTYIPNRADVTPQDDQSAIYNADWINLVRAFRGSGIMLGGAPTAAGTDLDVDVAAGIAVINDIAVPFSAGAVTLSAADGSNPRIDLVWVNASGTLGKTDGTPGADSSALEAPAPPANVAVIARVYVDTSATSIASSDINDMRLGTAGYRTGAVRYVDPVNGDDTLGTGSIARPLATVGAAETQLAPGTRGNIILLPGEYDEAVVSFDQPTRLAALFPPADPREGSVDDVVSAYFADAAGTATKYLEVNIGGAGTLQGFEIVGIGFKMDELATNGIALDVANVNYMKVDRNSFFVPTGSGSAHVDKTAVRSRQTSTLDNSWWRWSHNFGRAVTILDHLAVSTGLSNEWRIYGDVILSATNGTGHTNPIYTFNTGTNLNIIDVNADAESVETFHIENCGGFYSHGCFGEKGDDAIYHLVDVRGYWIDAPRNWGGSGSRHGVQAEGGFGEVVSGEPDKDSGTRRSHWIYGTATNPLDWRGGRVENSQYRSLGGEFAPGAYGFTRSFQTGNTSHFGGAALPPLLVDVIPQLGNWVVENENATPDWVSAGWTADQIESLHHPWIQSPNLGGTRKRFTSPDMGSHTEGLLWFAYDEADQGVANEQITVELLGERRASKATESAGDTVADTNNGLVNGNQIRIFASTDSALTVGDDYWVVGAATDTFQLSLTEGGAAIALTGGGTIDYSFIATSSVVELSLNLGHTDGFWMQLERGFKKRQPDGSFGYSWDYIAVTVDFAASTSVNAQQLAVFAWPGVDDSIGGRTSFGTGPPPAGGNPLPGDQVVDVANGVRYIFSGVASAWVRTDRAGTEVTGATTIDPDTPYRVWNCVAGTAYTVTLPDNADASGLVLVIHREGANNITISRAGTDTIEGATTKVLGSDGAAVALLSIGDGVWKNLAEEGTVT